MHIERETQYQWPRQRVRVQGWVEEVGFLSEAKGGKEEGEKSSQSSAKPSLVGCHFRSIHIIYIHDVGVII